jgi:hypothetical protein
MVFIRALRRLRTFQQPLAHFDEPLALFFRVGLLRAVAYVGMRQFA